MTSFQFWWFFDASDSHRSSLWLIHGRLLSKWRMKIKVDNCDASTVFSRQFHDSFYRAQQHEATFTMFLLRNFRCLFNLATCHVDEIRWFDLQVTGEYALTPARTRTHVAFLFHTRVANLSTISSRPWLLFLSLSPSRPLAHTNSVFSYIAKD